MIADQSRVSPRHRPEFARAKPESKRVNVSSFLNRIRADSGPAAGSIRTFSDDVPEPWADFLGRVRALAAGLVGYGFQPGDRASVVGEFGVDFLQGVLALWGAGGTVVPIGRSTREIDLQTALKQSRVRVVLAVAGIDLEQVLRVRPDLPDLELTLVFHREAGEGPSPARAMRDVEASGQAVLRQDPRVLSGAGLPPGVMLLGISAEGLATRRRDEGDLERETMELAQRFAISSSDRVFVSLRPTGGVEMDVSRLVMESGAELIFGSVERVDPAGFRKSRPTRAVVIPRWIEELEDSVEAELGRRGFFGRRFSEWAFRVAANSTRSSRKARAAERMVLKPLREQVTGGYLREILCVGAVPDAPRLQALGVVVRPIGGTT